MDSSTTSLPVHSLSSYVDEKIEKLGLNSTSLVFHIGSSKGSLLKLFKAKSIRTLGFEKDVESAKTANENKVTTINSSLTIELGWELLSESNIYTSGQKADLIIINNFLGYKDNLEELLGAIRLIIKDEGTISIEEKWIGKTSGTKLEPVSLSTYELNKILNNFDLEIIEIHQGLDEDSLCWLVKPSGLFSVSPTVIQYIGLEQSK